MAITMSDKKLKTFIKESVREVLDAELMKLRALALPDISKKEQKDIERRYVKPSRKREESYTLGI